MPPNLTVLVRRIIKAPVSRVFDAWTQPEQLHAWWGPGNVTCPEARVDLREGGHYAIANQMEDGNIAWIRGEFLEVVVPTKLVYSWGFGDFAPNEVVTVRFESHAKGTEVILSHTRISTEAARASHEAGWQGCLQGLSDFLETNAHVETRIRPENADDHPAVATVNNAAFDGPGEAALVDGLRALPDTISLVATHDAQVIGHVMFSAIDIAGTPAMALAPVAVSPDFQYRGIGKALIRAGLDACRQAGHQRVIVLGHQDYYPKFGFIPAQPIGITPPWNVPVANFMALALVPHGLDGVTGLVRYSEPFGAV